jgi:hypothetical protein
MAKILTTEERERLQTILAKPKADRTRDEAIEALILAFGTDPVQAAFIVSIERGEIEGDIVEL